MDALCSTSSYCSALAWVLGGNYCSCNFSPFSFFYRTESHISSLLSFSATWDQNLNSCVFAGHCVFRQTLKTVRMRAQHRLLPVYRCLRSYNMTWAAAGLSMDPSGCRIPSRQSPDGPYVPVAGVLFSVWRRQALNLYAIRDAGVQQRQQLF